MQLIRSSFKGEKMKLSVKDKTHESIIDYVYEDELY